MAEQSVVEQQANQPTYRASDLGRAIPDSEHAISVTLPTMDSVIRYEESDPAVVEALQCGYPRFVIHPLVEHLVSEFKAATPKCTESYVLPFPSEDAATECAQFYSGGGTFLNDDIRFADGVSVTAFSGRNDSGQPVYMLAIPDTEEGRQIVRSFWQHTGRITTSRHAASLLTTENRALDVAALDRSIRGDLARVSGNDIDSIRLYPTGMAAIYEAFQLVNIYQTGSSLETAASVQFGFPYVDTDKIQEKSENGRILLANGDAVDIETLRQLVTEGKVSAVFTEVPGNPLLRTPDLKALSEILRPAGIPLVVDETLGTFINVDVSEYADITVSSLSKYYTGSGTVMAGGLIVNEKSPLADELLKILGDGYELECHAEDLRVLEERGGNGFAERVLAINENAQALAEFLAEHPLVSKINYPSLNDSKVAFDAIKKEGGGYGGLLSIEFDSAKAAAAFYDALEVSKGPSLGTEYTLACPYTLLAHYNELDRVAENGISRNLIRISVGSIESPDELIRIFEKALAAIEV